ncbi:MAG: protein-glutamate O-methyltransferase CheR [Acidimicrobiales bacterium]
MSRSDVSPAALARATDEVARQLGLRIGGALRHRLRRLIASAAAHAGIEPVAWASSLADDRGRLEEVINAVTIQESAWFRDPAQFVALQRLVLPRAGGSLVWSAGVALGQEPYSLAMTLREGGRRHWEVLATDIDSISLAATAAGVFQPTQLGGLDRARRARWLHPVDRGWAVHEDLRTQVIVRRHNLATEALPPEIERCDVVFCRNVLIYLTEDGSTAFLSRLADSLRPGGVLFLGGSEALWRDTPHFVPVNLGGCYCYRRSAVRRADASGRRPVPPDRATVPAGPVPARQGSVPPADSEPDPPNAPALLAAGSSALDRGETTEAIRLLRQAAYLDPDLALAHFTLGLALEADGNPSGACRAWRAARAALVRSDEADGPLHPGERSSEVLASAIEVRLANSSEQPGPPTSTSEPGPPPHGAPARQR